MTFKKAVIPPPASLAIKNVSEGSSHVWNSATSMSRRDWKHLLAARPKIPPYLPARFLATLGMTIIRGKIREVLLVPPKVIAHHGADAVDVVIAEVVVA